MTITGLLWYCGDSLAGSAITRSTFYNHFQADLWMFISDILHNDILRECKSLNLKMSLSCVFSFDYFKIQRRWKCDVWRFRCSSTILRELCLKQTDRLKRNRQRSEYEGRQKWTFLFLLGHKQQWIVLTRPEWTRLNQTGPDRTRPGPVFTHQTESSTNRFWLDQTSRNRYGAARLTGTTNKLIRKRLLMSKTLRYHGNSQTGLMHGPVRCGQVRPGSTIFPLPSFRGVRRSRAGLLNQGKQRSWLVHKHQNPAHPPSSPGILLVAYIICKNRASPSPIGHHSLRQERPFLSHWSV